MVLKDIDDARNFKKDSGNGGKGVVDRIFVNAFKCKRGCRTCALKLLSGGEALRINGFCTNFLQV